MFCGCLAALDGLGVRGVQVDRVGGACERDADTGLAAKSRSLGESSDSRSNDTTLSAGRGEGLRDGEDPNGCIEDWEAGWDDWLVRSDACRLQSVEGALALGIVAESV